MLNTVFKAHIKHYRLFRLKDEFNARVIFLEEANYNPLFPNTLNRHEYAAYFHKFTLIDNFS